MTDQTPAAPELTPEQYGLLDALRDVAVSPDAPAATYAAEQIARLSGEAFGYPLDPMAQPTPVAAANLTIGPIDVQTVDGRRLAGLAARTEAGAPVETWPFRPGVIIRDENGDEASWLRAAPVGVVVVLDGARGRDREMWARHALAGRRAWVCLTGGPWLSSADLAALGTLRVVSVPGPAEPCAPEPEQVMITDPITAARWLENAPRHTIVRTCNGYEWGRLESGKWGHDASLATCDILARQVPVAVVRVGDRT